MWFAASHIRRTLAAATVLIAVTGPAGAGEASTAAKFPPVKAVLELFTSQGCSSCPPADKLFKSYANRRDLVALTLPVDYWDYLGWRDTLASARHSERQKDYARTRGDGAVYTPQIVLNGRTHVPGAKRQRIEGLVRGAEKSESSLLPYAVSVARMGDHLRIALGGDTAADPDTTLTVWVASVRPEASVKVKRGENRGETLTYYNVVRSLAPVGMWSGEKDVLDVPLPSTFHREAQRCAVLLQEGAGGPIVGAAWLPW